MILRSIACGIIVMELDRVPCSQLKLRPAQYFLANAVMGIALGPSPRLGSTLPEGE